MAECGLELLHVLGRYLVQPLVTKQRNQMDAQHGLLRGDAARLQSVGLRVAIDEPAGKLRECRCLLHLLLLNRARAVTRHAAHGTRVIVDVGHPSPQGEPPGAQAPVLDVRVVVRALSAPAVYPGARSVARTWAGGRRRDARVIPARHGTDRTRCQVAAITSVARRATPDSDRACCGIPVSGLEAIDVWRSASRVRREGGATGAPGRCPQDMARRSPRQSQPFVDLT